MAKFYPVLMVLFSWLTAFGLHYQMILLLLTMELAVLGIFITSLMFLPIMNIPLGVSFYILVMGAIEASLGLSLVILMTRQHGNDATTLIY